MNKRVAVVMAGGSGERFWPVSTKERPKQFLKLADPGKTLLAQSVERAAALSSPAQTYIATARHLAEMSGTACPQVPKPNILAEPAKRNTAGALVWVAANLIAQYPDNWAFLTVAVLTADQRIHTQTQFEETANRAMDAAESQGAIVTIGIRPDRPETGFGYIDCGEPVGEVFKVNKFTEKPDRATAEEFLSAGNFLWNSGMFFYTLPTFMSELERHQPDLAAGARKIAGELARGDGAAADATFEGLASISIDYALMEKSSKVLVAEATFEWDDLGAWDAIARTFPPDPQGNVAVGPSKVIESQDNVVYNESGRQVVNLLGVQGLAVVVTDGEILVMPTEKAQEVKKFLQ